jgi:malate dehydrogenase
MSLIAIIGAGPIGSTTAHTLAGRSRVREIRLIDAESGIAQGKALDIQQSGPVENFSTRLSGTDSLHATAGADVGIIADAASGAGEHTGEAGLAMGRRVVASGSTAPFLFAGATQRELMKRAITELHVSPSIVIGAAPFALESALRAMCGVLADCSAVEVALTVSGVPPRHAVVGWEEATFAGRPLTSIVAAHDLGGLAARIPGLWPPGPYALGSAAARVTEALVAGSRRRFSCFVDYGRGRIVAVPVELGVGGVKRVLEPVLTNQERTAFENSLDR